MRNCMLQQAAFLITKTYQGQLWHLSLLLGHLQSSSRPSQDFLSRYVTVRFLQALFSAYWMRVVITGVTTGDVKCVGLVNNPKLFRLLVGKSLKSIVSHKWVKTKLHPWLVVMKCLLLSKSLD